jgi:hypothetical protein
MMKLEGVRFVFVSSVMKMKTKQPSKKEQFGNYMTFRGKRGVLFGGSISHFICKN